MTEQQAIAVPEPKRVKRRPFVSLRDGQEEDFGLLQPIERKVVGLMWHWRGNFVRIGEELQIETKEVMEILTRHHVQVAIDWFSENRGAMRRALILNRVD